MDRLLAVNERVAVYVRDANASQKEVDPFRYLNDLLSIRSAKGLVDFLSNYPNGLHTRSNSAPLEELLQGASSPSGKLAFGEGAMIKAAENHNLDYLDAMTITGLQGYTTTRDLELELKEPEEKMRDWYSQWTEAEVRHYYSLLRHLPDTELSVVSIADLESLIYKIESLLLVAALSYYEIHGDLYKHFQIEKVLVLTRNVMVRVDREWLSTLLPLRPVVADDTDIKHLLDDINEQCMMHNMGVTQGGDGGTPIVDTPTQDMELGLRYAAGCVVSFLLSRWNHYFSAEEYFSYDIERGYQFFPGYTNPIVLELSSIIAEHRFGVCPICERPFVVKRRPVDGVLNKTFCTNSCKVKGNTDGRWKERPKKTLRIKMPDVDYDRLLKLGPPNFVQVDKL